MSSHAEEKIRELAYSLWEKAGRPCGDGVEFWLQAETKLKPSLKTAAKKTTGAKK